MAAANEAEAVGVVHIGAAGAQRDVLLAGVDQPAIDLVRLGRRTHAQNAVLGLEHDFALLRHVVGDLQGRADAEIDVPALGNVAGKPRGDFAARHRLAAGKNLLRRVHCFLRHVTLGSPYGTCTTRLTKIPGVAIFSGSSAPSSTMCCVWAIVNGAAVAITGLKLRADDM